MQDVESEGVIVRNVYLAISKHWVKVRESCCDLVKHPGISWRSSMPNLWNQGFFIEDDGCSKEFGQYHDLVVYCIGRRLIRLLQVDVGSLHKSIWFCSQSSCSIVNNIIKAEEIFCPASLSVAKLLCGGKIPQVIMVREYLYLILCTFKVCSPLLKHFVDCE